MHRALRHGAPHLLERVEETELDVITQGELTISRVRVLPRDHEYGVPLLDQVAHQRVARREVENVVLHDPGGSDEDRLRVHRRSRWRVLQQLDEAVAEYHLARSDRDVAPDLVVLGAGD